MTCEVIVMNRLGLALAADSAVTFTSRSISGDSNSFATGANKIFQLSNNEPVGVMIFNNASLQDVPWELILKSFRSHLGDDKLQNLNDYAQALRDFIANNYKLFPSSHRDEHLRSLIARTALIVINEIKTNSPDLFDITKAASHQILWQTYLQNTITNLASIQLPTDVDPQVLTNVLAGNTGWLATEITAFLTNDVKTQHLSTILDGNELSKIAIESLFKFYPAVFGCDFTGVVIAGYGADDYFPSYIELKYYGFVSDVLLFEVAKNQSIDHSKNSVIEAFAMRSMVETFVNGYSVGVWDTVNEKFIESCNKIGNSLTSSLGQSLPADWSQQLINACSEFSQNWTTDVLDNHYRLLKNVIAGLSMDEMSELVETLVMLESLKEKVTSRSQSVGGPVDVAVITKSEGVVWIKRKYFFDPSINHRYFMRQQKTL